MHIASGYFFPYSRSNHTPKPRAFSERQEQREGCGQQQELAPGTGCSSRNGLTSRPALGQGLRGECGEHRNPEGILVPRQNRGPPSDKKDGRGRAC